MCYLCNVNNKQQINNKIMIFAIFIALGILLLLKSIDSSCYALGVAICVIFCIVFLPEILSFLFNLIVGIMSAIM